MSLYRKYRPKAFQDVVGQEHVVVTLERAVEQDKLSHAYLFAGERGTGKTSIARILALHVLTRGVTDEKIKAQITKSVEDGNLVDLLEIDAASNRGIDDVRDLIEKIQFSPLVSSAKVYIIDEVHMLTKEAFNALLKTLEEPPSYAYFILATTELNKIPATIQSRCQSFPFHRIREEDIIGRLRFISEQEGINIEDAALLAIATHAQGGMRDAISFLDQMRSLAHIGITDVEERIGGTGQEEIQAILEAIEQCNRQAILQSARRMEDTGVPPDIFLRSLLSTVRESLHAAIANNEPANRYVHMLNTLLEAIREVRGAPLPFLVLETALLSLCGNQEEEPDQRRTMFGFAKAATKPAPSPQKAEPVPEVPEKKLTIVEEGAPAKSDALIEAPELSLQSLKEVWPDIVDQTTPAFVKASLKTGRVSAVEGNKVKVSFVSSFHKDKVGSPEGSRKVEEVMERLFKRQLRLECVVEGSDKASGSDDMVNMAEAAAEVF